MGQKVNPKGFRVAVSKDWDSKWFASKAAFGDWLHEDVAIRDFVKKNYASAAIARILIHRASNRIAVNIHSARPGVLASRREGSTRIQERIAKLAGGRDVKIDITEIKNPETNAQLVAENIAGQLERRIGFRRAMKKAVQTAMDMGVEGIKIKAAGRLGNAELARTEQYKDGKIPLHTIRAGIEYGFAEANTTAGKIGVKVWICKNPGEAK